MRQGKVELTHLCEQVQRYLGVAALMSDQPVVLRSTVRPRGASAEREPSPWSGGARLAEMLERAMWHLAQTREVQRARAVLGGGKLAPADAVQVLTSPLLARLTSAEWERLGLPLVHQAQRRTPEALAAESPRGDELYEVRWSAGAQLVPLPRLPALVTPAEPIAFPLDRNGREWLPITLQVAVAGSPLALLYRAARLAPQLGFLSLGWALAWVLCAVTPPAERWWWTRLEQPAWYRFPSPYPVTVPQVTLRVLAGVPEGAVGQLYRDFLRAARERGDVLGAPALASPRPVGERALARFWHERVERSGERVAYEGLRREWNALHPGWAYRDRKSFWRALRNAVEEIYGIRLARR